MYKSGFISIIGEPNVGKSTLMNAFLNEKIAITSYKPQTTRTRIMGIITSPQCQMVFLDTPGIHRAKDQLGQYMVKTANMAMADGDVVLHVIDASRPHTEVASEIEERLQKLAVPILLVLNKIDTIPKDSLLPIIEKFSQKNIYKEIVPISALQHEGVTDLLALIENHLEEGPQYFPDGQITDQPEKVIVAEMIREKILLLMQEEIPHGVAVVVESIHTSEDDPVAHIEATIFCERESHKGMIIGKKGQMMKDIASRARKDIEKLFGKQVYLETWVKVKKNWKNSAVELKNFGYTGKQ